MSIRFRFMSKVVVEEDHVGRVLGHLAAHDAHGDADVSLLNRGAVVHAVAGHRDDVALALVVLDDDELLLRELDHLPVEHSVRAPIQDAFRRALQRPTTGTPRPGRA